MFVLLFNLDGSIALTSSLPLVIETNRLWLRRWRDSDRTPFAAMNADSKVMEYFPGVMTRADSDALADRIQQHFDDHGFGLWAVEIKESDPFVGFIGLAIPRFEAHFTPCVEIGWRLAAKHWRRGYATEGARAALDYAFREVGLEEVVSMTTVANERSRRVMERIEMTHAPGDDFDHPLVPSGDALSRPCPIPNGTPQLHTPSRCQVAGIAGNDHPCAENAILLQRKDALDD